MTLCWRASMTPMVCCMVEFGHMIFKSHPLAWKLFLESSLKISVYSNAI